MHKNDEWRMSCEGDIRRTSSVQLEPSRYVGNQKEELQFGELVFKLKAE